MDIAVYAQAVKKLFVGYCPTCAKAVSILSRDDFEKKKEKPITNKSAKAKGRKAQQEVAQILMEAFGLTPEDFESIGGGQSGQDIRMTDKARKCWAFHAIEITAHLTRSVWAKFRQAETHAQKQRDGKVPGNARPILIFKKNGSPLYAMVYFKDLVEAIRERTPKRQP
jgi:predicted DCC family thiol-disulfide oxidoreductase YuxK